MRRWEGEAWRGFVPALGAEHLALRDILNNETQCLGNTLDLDQEFLQLYGDRANTLWICSSRAAVAEYSEESYAVDVDGWIIVAADCYDGFLVIQE